MNILSRVKLFYDQTGGDMFSDISAYASKGYVFITPQTFLLGKAVNSKSEIHPDNQWMVSGPDAWYVRTAIGDNAISEFIDRIPHPLPLVGWMRQLKKKPIKWYDFNRIIRRK
tara:strand:- start:773 stop:1111 length:339 start_codon:yes stop_codon:yes gene_type:complete